MTLTLKELNKIVGYVAVVDNYSGREYFSQGDEAYADIDMIDEHGEDAFLDHLNSSGYFG